jgi:hypothetical protein
MYQYNYNKKIKNIKLFDKEEYKKLTLLNYIIDLFPKTLLVSETKTTLKNKGIKRVKKNIDIFFKNEFIYFNEEVCNFIIIDIDHKKYSIYNFLMELRDYNIIPNWIVETTKGYQLGWILDRPFVVKKEFQSEKDKKLESYSLYIQKCLSYHFEGDENSFRIKGVFRNPIGQSNKKLYFNVNYKYQLNELDVFYLPTQTLQKKGNFGGNFHKNDKEIINIKTIIIKLLNGELSFLNNVKIGQRNSFIWYLGMYLSKTNKNDWENRLDFYNSNLIQPLKENEMENIKKSIKKYNKEKKNFITIGGYNSWTKEMKNIYQKEYQKKKGIVKYSREERKEVYKNKILNTIIKYKKENNKVPSIRKISNISKISKNTVNKYVKELKSNKEYNYLFEKKG